MVYPRKTKLFYFYGHKLWGEYEYFTRPRNHELPDGGNGFFVYMPEAPYFQWHLADLTPYETGAVPPETRAMALLVT